MDSDRNESAASVEKRPTASETVAAAATAPTVIATVVPTGPAPVDVADGNVEDAEFEPKTFDDDPNLPGSALGDTLDQLAKAGESYFGNSWPARRDQALADRGCSVLQNLSQKQASELLAKIEGLIRDRKALEKN